MSKKLNLFVTCAKNLEGLLEDELIRLGATNTKQTVAGVAFTGDLAFMYRVCLWSRLANRVLLHLGSCNAEDAEALYEGVSKINWTDHIKDDGSLAVDFAGVSAAINNSYFGALKVKDAIVDQIRKKTGRRPNIDKENPDVRVNVYLNKGEATISLDLSGDSLHFRGYRNIPGEAPLKETLAAAILYRSNWLEFAGQGLPLFDPMCGSGTILIEAAMMAQDYAPALMREKFGFMGWVNHDQSLWNKLLSEASDRKYQGAQKCKVIIGGADLNHQAITIAKRCIHNVGLENVVVEVGGVKDVKPIDFNFSVNGLVVTNPPYGKRLEKEQDKLVELYSSLGGSLRNNFVGWTAAIFTGNPTLGKNLGMRPKKQYNFFNGTIPCKLLIFDVQKENFWREYVSGES